MIHIQEHLSQDEDCTRVNLVDAMHETLWPLNSFYCTLNEVSQGESETALVLETLLNHATDMQAEIIEYLESKFGKIELVCDKKNINSAYHANMYIRGIKVNGEHVQRELTK